MKYVLKPSLFWVNKDRDLSKEATQFSTFYVRFSFFQKPVNYATFTHTSSS